MIGQLLTAYDLRLHCRAGLSAEDGWTNGRFVRMGRRIAHTCTRDRPTNLTRALTYGCGHAQVCTHRMRACMRARNTRAERIAARHAGDRVSVPVCLVPG